MGRSIPSFRMLIDIERPEWREFKEELSNRQDKENFNKLFSIPKLYCHSLSNLSKPIIIEPILLSVLFQSFKENDNLPYKPIVSTSNNKSSDVVMQGNVKGEIKFVTPTNCQISDSNYNFSQILKEWKEFSDCLSKEDESIFIEMIARCYDDYHLAINSYENSRNSNNANREKGPRRSSAKTTTSLFMALYLYQQKQLNYMKSNQRQLDFYT